MLLRPVYTLITNVEHHFNAVYCRGGKALGYIQDKYHQAIYVRGSSSYLNLTAPLKAQWQ